MAKSKKKYNKKEYIEKQKQKQNDMLKKIEEGIKNTLNSDKYKEYLKMQAKFHCYSYNNTMMLLLQNPNITYVAGYRQWQKKFSRNVKKGEKGLEILVPCIYKSKKETQKIDKKTQKPVIDKKTGEPVTEIKNIKKIYFKTAKVFDVKQTEGEAMPEICAEISGESESAKDIVKAIKNISKIPVIEEEIKSGAKGYYSKEKNIIALKKDMSMDHKAKTIIHEYAHSLLHKDKGTEKSRSMKEIEAESIAYIVSEKYGVDTKEYSFEYLADWSKDKDNLKDLKSSFETIQKTSSKIINEISEELGLSRNAKMLNLEIEENPYDKSNVYSGKIKINNNTYDFYQSEQSREIFPQLDKIDEKLKEDKLTQETFEEIVIKTIEIYMKNIKDIIKSHVNIPFSNFINEKSMLIMNKYKDGYNYMNFKIRHKALEKKINKKEYTKEEIKEYEKLDQVMSDLNKAKLEYKRKQVENKEELEQEIEAVS